jgi:uncharacterized RmlC-like cupin family protein
VPITTGSPSNQEIQVSDLLTNDAHTPQLAAAAPGQVIIIRAAGTYDGRQGLSLATGVSSRSAGAQGLCLHVVTIPPGSPHLPVNRRDVTAVAVVSRTDPHEQEAGSDL